MIQGNIENCCECVWYNEGHRMCCNAESEYGGCYVRKSDWCEEWKDGTEKE